MRQSTNSRHPRKECQVSRGSVIDRNEVLRALKTHEPVSSIARRLGVSIAAIYQIERIAEHKCQRCRTPLEDDARSCPPCREYEREYQRRRRIKSIATGTCVSCSLPTEGGTKHCKEHRVSINQSAKQQRVKRKETRGEEWMATQSEWNRRQLYGEVGVRVWNRTKGTCQVCGTPYRKRHSHIHHMDGNKTRNTEENLICLCSACHHLLHRLQWHPRLDLFLPWFREMYPENDIS
jgi:hypothetical protein